MNDHAVLLGITEIVIAIFWVISLFIRSEWLISIVLGIIIIGIEFHKNKCRLCK